MERGCDPFLELGAQSNWPSAGLSRPCIRAGNKGARQDQIVKYRLSYR